MIKSSYLLVLMESRSSGSSMYAGEGGGGGGGLLSWPLVYPGMNQNQKVQTDTLSCFFPSFYFPSSPRLKESREK